MTDCKPARDVAQGQGTGLACTGQEFYSSIGSKAVGHQGNVTEHKVGTGTYAWLSGQCATVTPPPEAHTCYIKGTWTLKSNAEGEKDNKGC